jgi:hypothetical protein
MNERIKILLKQATITRYSGYAWSDEVDQQQFAELIVKECAQLARDTDLEDVEGGDSAVLRAAKSQILEHFGVEE